MKGYWAYVLSFGGNVINRIDLRCVDEEDAKDQARALAVRDPVELWDGDLFIKRFDPEP